jgi:hypothetical protein
MPITLTCPYCDAQLDAPDDIAGRKVLCNKCGKKFRAPALEEDDQDDRSARRSAKSASKSRSRSAASAQDEDERSSRRTDKASRRRERDDQDDRDGDKDRTRRRSQDENEKEDEPPRKKKGKKKKKAGSPVTRLILIGVVVLLLIAGIGAWISFSGDKSDGSANKGGPVSDAGGAPAGDPNLPGWLEFADPNGQFKVRVPRMPAAATKQLWAIPNGEQAEATIYTVEIGGGMYSMAHLVVPGREPGAPADPLLDDAIGKGMGWTKGAVIKNQVNITYQGFPGRQAVPEYKGVKGSTVLRVILAGNRMFWLLASGDNFAADTPKVKGFLDSLKIN